MEALHTDLLEQIKAGQPTLWTNPAYRPAKDDQACEDLARACENWQNLASLLKLLFPEVEASQGKIASDLIKTPGIQNILGYTDARYGDLYVKADHALPIAGSVKARGGIYEVMMIAELQARSSGFLAPDESICKLASEAARTFFAERTIAVGSTGNLGLSVGIAARTLGYNAVVHMSADAKKWKIERLRRFGVKVKQHRGDYNLAVAAARDAASRDPMTYFVDDEDSELLFSGYSAAAAELQSQLEAQGTIIGPDRPLFLYLPCGIGGAPGGIAYGARAVFGPDAHCFFAEPTQSPSAMVQMMHGPGESISVYDVGLSNKTEADGMAVATMSALVARKMQQRLAGSYTLGDDDLLRLVAIAHDQQGLQLEPSATIGFAGPHFLLDTANGRAFCERHVKPESLENAVHVVWTTGGSFVPELQFQTFLGKGTSLDMPLDLMKGIA